ncbi:MAG: hypothetical protein OXH36_03250 [Bdellovibrionales bacterium]|nr:hypothetical protein [Bdellovibrionales bacterium]
MMKPTKSFLMKRYMAIYRKNPKSKVFAFLADRYRKQGALDKALELCRRGIKEHPQFASGHIALALVFLDMNKWEMAVESLEKAVDLSPENIFAYKMLGQAWLRLKNPEKTLQAYKMVLFLDPTNEKASSIIKKLEPMTADQYDKTGFAFKNLEEVAQYISVSSPSVPEGGPPVLHPIPKDIASGKKGEQFEAQSAMIEALIYRKEFVKARQFLQEMKNIYAHNKNWNIRIQKLEKKLPSADRESKGEEMGKDSFSVDNTVFASASHLNKGSKGARLGTSTAYFNPNNLGSSKKTATPSIHGVTQQGALAKGSEKSLSSGGVRKQAGYSHQVSIRSARSQKKQEKIKKLRRLLNRIKSIQSHVAYQP